ncbi:hypothetical protein H9C73_14845 [Marinobacterium sp. AK62]|uniref:Uncharacterized protein n=1 Tax=Marinobacterium alkalitolerans TaxID=1542925 RepID=A0ABS3ZG39_9GAMM|nr:hypothetical protein [Marinobacterium alkalitolerans]MBP0050009.1 hypothetical protein [Marinobacterium alkalitolerans]
MRKTPIAFTLLAILLSGCNAAQTQPQSAAGPAAQAPGENSASASSDQPAARETSASQPSAGSSSSGAGALQSGFDQLSGRLTLLQEQVLQIRSANQQLLEQNQMLMNQLDVLTRTQPAADAEGDQTGTEDQASIDQLDAAIGQLMQILNQAELPVVDAPRFGLATTYTQKGDWVLLRYDRTTGDTWRAEYGDWQLIEEEMAPEASAYEVQITRADRNTAGYVAVRIDLNSGRSWWLNGKRWQEY